MYRRFLVVTSMETANLNAYPYERYNQYHDVSPSPFSLPKRLRKSSHDTNMEELAGKIHRIWHLVKSGNFSDSNIWYFENHSTIWRCFLELGCCLSRKITSTSHNTFRIHDFLIDSEMANPTRYFQESREIRLFFFYSNHEIRKVGFPDSRICPYSNRPNQGMA